MADALGTPGPPAGPGVVSALDHRLDQAALIAPQGAGMAVRTGVMWGPGSTALVTGTSSTAPMTYAIAANHWVTTRGTADGVYLGALEAPTTVTTTAAPGANSRIDVIWEKQQDQYSSITPDGTSAPLYGCTQGTAGASPAKPTIPVGAKEIATAVVSVGATNTNDGTKVLITNTAEQVVARGAAIPVRNQAERDALTKYPLLTVKRLDTGDIEMVNLANNWVTVYTAPIATPYLFTVLATAGSSLNNSAWEDVPFDQDDTDTDGWHNAAAVYPASVLATVNRTGWFFVQAGIAWGANATGFRGVRMIKNGTAGVAGLTGTLVRGSGLVLPSAGAGVITSTVTPQRRIFLNSGDTLKVQGIQNSGAALGLRNVIAGSDDQVCFLEVRFDRA